MALRKVSIPTLHNQVGILTLHRAILEWYRFILCPEYIYGQDFHEMHAHYNLLTQRT